jgi:phosphoribosylformylglycinamidine cyclo-ligase
MPGFYADGEYDIAGFIVGLVDRAKIVDGSAIEPGDAIVGLPSAGLHTNGYSLARHVFFQVHGLAPADVLPELGTSLADALLAPHRSYLRAVRPLLDHGLVKGMAHITGGGLTENVPRMLPSGCGVRIDRRSWQVPPIFQVLQARGAIADAEMLRSFNMGIGLVVACAAGNLEAVRRVLMEAGEPDVRVIGAVEAGDRAVRYGESA